MQLKEILRGCTPGKIQSVGIMDIIPLLSDDSNDKYVCPVNEEIDMASPNYGTLNFYNNTDKVLIVPMHTSYVVPEKRCQDHAMAHTGVVNKRSYGHFDSAMCVESDQGGHFKRDHYKMSILPFSLREMAFKMKNTKAYNKLWNHISKFNSDMNVRKTGAHLEYFLTSFKQELDQFVAQFELVNKQVGAIILIDGSVVGVEKAPSYEFWSQIFKPLIRDCYGSLAMATYKSKQKIKASKYKIAMKGNATNLGELQQELITANKETEDNIKELVRELAEQKFTVQKDEEINKIKLLSLDQENFSGQIVSEDLKPIYLSLIGKESWIRNSEWLSQKEFSI